MSEFGAWSTKQLATLPAKAGFRQRGMDMTRLETFADAAFAFAVTLLVVGGGDSIPGDFDEMVSAMKQIPAFAASFANIMLFWYAHHIWSRRFGLDDTASIFLSLILIFVVLIYVYPLKAIYSGAIAFFTNGYFESYFKLDSFDDLRILFVIFGLGYAALSGVIAMLNRHAFLKKEQLSLSNVEIFDTQAEIYFWIMNAIVAIISIILAVVLPDELVSVAGMFYGVFGIIIPWYRIRQWRIRPAVEDPPDAGDVNT